jgi:hypothetical protein
MNFDEKAKILADILTIYSGVPEWTPFIIHANLGLPFAWGYVNEYITLNDNARELVLNTWETLLTALNLPDGEYSDVNAVMDAAADMSTG